MTQQQQQQQPAGSSANYESRLGILEAAVSNIATQLGQISNKLEARSSINWTPIGILVGVLGSIGGMGFTWINTGQNRLETLIAKIEMKAERYVPREDIDVRFDGLKTNITERFNVSADRRNDLQKLTDERIARIERDIATAQKEIVPRGEHEQTWATQRARDEALQRQLDGLRAGLSDLNTPRDTIQAMLRRLDDLDRAVRAAPTKAAP